MLDYALSTALFESYPLAEAIDMMVRAGFRQVELSGSQLETTWLTDVALCRRLFEDAGIDIASFHSPDDSWDNDNVDPALRRASNELAADSMRTAAELGARIIIIHPNRILAPFPEAEVPKRRANSRASLEFLAAEAEKAGIMMAVENLPARGLPRPGNSIADVQRLIDGLGGNVGICLDAGHSNANGISAAREVHDAGNKLIALHIQDNDGQGEDQHILPGAGTVDWDAFLVALDEEEFGGLRTFEVMKGDAPPALLASLSGLRAEWLAKAQ